MYIIFRHVDAGVVVEVSEEGRVGRDEANERSQADLHMLTVPGKLSEHGSTGEAHGEDTTLC